ncbi:hypothetical protein BHE74_00026502, partial [Ensete ventricosum]
VGGKHVIYAPSFLSSSRPRIQIPPPPHFTRSPSPDLLLRVSHLPPSAVSLRFPLSRRRSFSGLHPDERIPALAVVGPLSSLLLSLLPSALGGAMDHEMAEATDEVFVCFEVDLDYEFDAPRYFDLGREETPAEARAAELWFDTAGSYPPSRTYRLPDARNPRILIRSSFLAGFWFFPYAACLVFTVVENRPDILDLEHFPIKFLYSLQVSDVKQQINLFHKVPEKVDLWLYSSLTCIVYFEHTSECKRAAEVKDISTKFRPQALNQKLSLASEAQKATAQRKFPLPSRLDAKVFNLYFSLFNLIIFPSNCAF